jgi:hypothetical protein
MTIVRRKFQSILYGVTTRMGLDPLVNLNTNQQQEIGRYIQFSVQRAWERYFWPELRLLEQRYYYPLYTNQTPSNIVIGDSFYYDNGTDSNFYWQALVDAPVDPPSSTDTTEWSEYTNFALQIALDQDGETVIGDVLEIWSLNPRLNLNATTVYYTLNDNGILIPPGGPASVYIDFMKRAPDFSGTPWYSTTTYNTGDVIYYSPTGECYKATTGNLNQPPPSSGTSNDYWEMQQIPEVFCRYVEMCAYADTLKEDWQNAKAISIEVDADNLLQESIDRIELKQQMLRNNRFSVSVPFNAYNYGSIFPFVNSNNN